MPDWDDIPYRPGSFTKNFGWNQVDGLGLLHRAIRLAFADGPAPVDRNLARDRIAAGIDGDPLVPLNFFLFNKIEDGASYIWPDNLVLAALNSDPGPNFDLLAITAFNMSRVGTWDGARDWQSNPAPWARKFIIEVLWREGGFPAQAPSADELEAFLVHNLEYEAKTPRKYATNLHYIYDRSSLFALHQADKAQWWAAAVFLFLERCSLDGDIAEDQPITDVVDFIFAEVLPKLLGQADPFSRDLYTQIVEEFREGGSCKGWLRTNSDRTTY